MSFKSLFKQYAGTKASMHSSEESSSVLGKRPIRETSETEENSLKKEPKLISRYIVVFQLAVAEFSLKSLEDGLRAVLKNSSFNADFDSCIDCRNDLNSIRVGFVSTSRSICEAFANCLCKSGELLPSIKLRIVSITAWSSDKLSSPPPLSFRNFVSSAVEMTSSVVIAKYRENVDWVPQTWRKKVHLYCKAPLSVSDSNRFDNIVVLPNVGRESHTYLHHIIENYDNLTDIVYFTQANPFDHAPHFESAVESNIGLCRPYQGLSNVTATVYNFNVSQYEHAFPGIQEGFTKVVRELFGADFEKPVIWFYPGAIMAVHKELIHRRPIDFYRKCLKLLDYTVDPIEGYAFERLWALIFDDSGMNWPPKSSFSEESPESS